MVHFNVNFASFNSFADITLELGKTLEAMGIPVSLEPSSIQPIAWQIFTDLEKRLLGEWMQRPPSELFQVKWSHYWKDYLWKQQRGLLNLEFFAINYEFADDKGEFDYWIADAVSNSAHKVAVSRYCQEILLKAGCPASQVSVIPLGFNPYLMPTLHRRKPLKSQDQFKYILHITNSHDVYRFGTDILLRAYCEEFRDNFKVMLVIKDGGSQASLILNILEDLKKEFGKSMPWFQIKKKLVTKQELANLYLSADAFIAPFRGEGFAIKVLDALAAGLPVAIPLYGGPTEYANAANCYPIAYNLVPVGECYDTQKLNVQNSPHWAEPTLASVREQLRNIVEDPGRGLVAQRAQETAAEFSWEATARKLLKLMRQLF
ncbi:MAG: glycosyltransferase family 4 protein [Actinomycetota bacterium]